MAANKRMEAAPSARRIRRSGLALGGGLVGRLAALLLLLISANAFPCAYVGDAPSPIDLVREFRLQEGNAEEIVELRVDTTRGEKAEVTVLRVFKSSRGLPARFRYEAKTSCDAVLTKPGGVYVIFANWFDGELYVFEGNAMRSDHESYARLLQTLGA